MRKRKRARERERERERMRERGEDSTIMRMEPSNAYGEINVKQPDGKTNDPYLKYMKFVNLNSLCSAKLNISLTNIIFF